MAAAPGALASGGELQDLDDVGGLADRLRVGAGEDRQHRVPADQFEAVFTDTDIGEPPRQAELRQLSERLHAMEADELCRTVRVVRLRKCWDKQYQKLLLVVTDRQMMATIAAALQHLGAKPLHGGAPRGGLERAIERFFEAEEGTGTD